MRMDSRISNKTSLRDQGIYKMETKNIQGKEIDAKRDNRVLILCNNKNTRILPDQYQVLYRNLCSNTICYARPCRVRRCAATYSQGIRYTLTNTLRLLNLQYKNNLLHNKISIQEHTLTITGIKYVWIRVQECIRLKVIEWKDTKYRKRSSVILRVLTNNSFVNKTAIIRNLGMRTQGCQKRPNKW